MLAAVLAVVVLSGCKSIVQKVFGSSNEVQEDDTTQWAVLSSDPLVIDGIADTTAKYATARANGALNIVFNGIWSRQTEYFTVPSGLLSIYGCGTTDGGAQKFKVSLWKKVDGGVRICDRQHLLYPYRRHRLPLHHLRAGPSGAVPCDHLL